MKLAIVVAVHPERRTVDIVYTHNNQRAGEVHVLSSAVSSDSGEWDFPSVPRPTSEAAAGDLPTNGRQVVAAVDVINGRPVVIGFLHPLHGQMAFNQQDRQVSRHPSGAYTTIAPDGSIEVYHPSGAYVRLGTGSAHEDLTPHAAGAWRVPAGAPAPTVTVQTAKFMFTVDPAGNLTMHTSGNATLQADGNFTITATGAFAVHAATIDLNS